MPEFNLTQEQYDELMKKLRILSFQQQESQDLFEGGLTSRNLMSFRTNYVFNEADSLDADNPFIMDFEIIDETIKIVSVKVSFKIKYFRAYSKAGAAAGTPSGGGSTTPSGGGGTTPSGGGSTSGSGGGQTSSTESQYSTIPYVVGGIIGHDGGWLINAYSQNLKVAGYAHTHTVSNHTHSTPSHTHNTPNHTHNTPDHTHPNHTHDAVYGIYEEETSPTIHFWVSEDESDTMWKGKHGGYTEDQKDLDITSYLTGNGDKRLKFTSDVRCRISAMILLKLDIKAR